MQPWKQSYQGGKFNVLIRLITLQNLRITFFSITNYDCALKCYHLNAQLR